MPPNGINKSVYESNKIGVGLRIRICRKNCQNWILRGSRWRMGGSGLGQGIFIPTRIKRSPVLCSSTIATVSIRTKGGSS